MQVMVEGDEFDGAADAGSGGGAEAVDPRTAEICVTFSTPMAGGLSWTGSGPEYPACPEGEKPRWSDDRG